MAKNQLSRPTQPGSRLVRAAGAVTNWEFEIGAPALLMRNGWTRNSLKAGDQIVVESYLAKDGTNLANARTVKTVAGQKLFAGGGDGEPAP